MAYLDGFVIDINPYNRVGSQLLGFRNHLPYGRLPRLPQGSLVASRTATNYVPQACEQVSIYVSPENSRGCSWSGSSVRGRLMVGGL